MIRPYNHKIGSCGFSSVVLAIGMVGLVGAAHGRSHECVLLLRQNPADAGIVTPAAGIHSFEEGSTITLTAAPKPGYEFVCWLGDVSDPTSSSTFLTLDAPKIVVAVFERAEFEFMVAAGELRERSMAIGGVVSSAGDYRQQGFIGSGGRRRASSARYELPDEWEWPDFPVPDEGDEFPVPEKIPEPATMLLLLAGGLFANSFRSTGRSNRGGAAFGK